MHAMQYEITLPADYNMGIIRERVATKGRLLDGFPGLGFKAYLMRERGVAGSPVNAYAPFYVWNTAEGMNSFLWGDGFRGIIRDFGRPVVQHWTGLGFAPGPAYGRAPRAAAISRRTLGGSEDPATAIGAALGESATVPGLHSATVAIDPRHWELVRCTLWDGAAPEDAGDRYEVLYLCTPEIDAPASAVPAVVSAAV
ncbi:DUF4865 family protein [Streptomyces sp. A7024]|uniref:DUF4865 family protein n=1 Tax=Streptomyces coryli TaxID=1128680 RepID=A0A6G4U100_9ACTN|nr:DUF4865 family protein [Streptomyces coryli]NGN65905.1 DUF4865 family protein [Streptomyces coryli]